MSEKDASRPGQKTSEGLSHGENLNKGLHAGQRGQDLSTTVQMPVEGPPGDSAVSPPPPPASSDSASGSDGD